MGQQKQIWVHIGLPKCGSSTIQGYFADNEVHYRQHGLCYPKTRRTEGGYRSHHPLADADPAELPAIIDTIAEEAGDATDILISCEAYTSALPAGQGQALVRELKRAFPGDTITVVAYFRNIYEFIESSYAQLIMGGLFQVSVDKFFSKGKPSIRKFITRFEDIQGFPIYSIQQFAEKIQATFPDTKVLLRSLEKNDLGGAGIIEDLCGVMGYAPLPMNTRRNARASNRTIAAAQFLRTKLRNRDFVQIKLPLRKLDLDMLADDPEAPFRNKDICIGSQLRILIREQIKLEKDALPALFDTPCDALTEDRWKPILVNSELAPAMRKKALNMVKRRIGQDKIRTS